MRSCYYDVSGDQEQLRTLHEEKAHLIRKIKHVCIRTPQTGSIFLNISHAHTKEKLIDAAVRRSTLKGIHCGVGKMGYMYD